MFQTWQRHIVTRMNGVLYKGRGGWRTSVELRYLRCMRQHCDLLLRHCSEPARSR
jgi:hypothetical protein